MSTLSVTDFNGVIASAEEDENELVFREGQRPPGSHTVSFVRFKGFTSYNFFPFHRLSMFLAKVSKEGWNTETPTASSIETDVCWQIRKNLIFGFLILKRCASESLELKSQRDYSRALVLNCEVVFCTGITNDSRLGFAQ